MHLVSSGDNPLPKKQSAVASARILSDSEDEAKSVCSNFSANTKENRDLLCLHGLLLFDWEV